MAPVPLDVDSDSDGTGNYEYDASTVPPKEPMAGTSAEQNDAGITLALSVGHPGPETACLKHESLRTEFIGIHHHVSTAAAQVHQFRGIKYASVPMRFRHSVLFDTYGSTVDATKQGPISPQIRNRWLESRIYRLPHDILPPNAHKYVEDEFECCNLTISKPAPSLIEKLGPLPVMVWIHGGGNVTGSGTDWIWDAGALVHKSITCGKPVIIVALNFRLGLFGFAASELLREDNIAAGEAGVGNYGLCDQRVALQWIRKHIAGFGGNPSSITLFGSSWGAADIHAHLLSSANLADVMGPPNSDGPLFHRAILQSGALVPSSSVVQDISFAGHHLGRVMRALHVTTIEELRAVPAEKLVSVTGERVRPVDDGVFLRSDWRTLALPYSIDPETPPHWRQDVIIGDVACESVLWATPARLWAADAVSRRARAIVQSVRRADALMRAYDIAGAPASHSRAMPPIDIDFGDDENGFSEVSTSDTEEGEGELAERVMELMNDVAFAWPVDVAARCAADSAYLYKETPHSVRGKSHLCTVCEIDFEAKSERGEMHGKEGHKKPPMRYPNAPFVYRYVFDQASPYTQTPHHGVDLLYLFGNIPFPTDPDLTPEENEEVNWDHKKVRAEVQDRWLAFAYKECAWDPLTPQRPAGVANMSDRGLFATPMLEPVSSFHPHGLAPSPGSTSPVSSRASSFSSFSGYVASRSDAPYAYAHPPFHQNSSFNYSYQSHSYTQSAPWHASKNLYGSENPPPISISADDKVFVFGPEGETGTRSARIFAGRRRVHAWRDALAPLGLATAQRVGLELGNGPPSCLRSATL